LFYPSLGFYVALPSGGRAVYLLSSHRSCWERYRVFYEKVTSVKG
jgi:hypothetical protein